MEIQNPKGVERNNMTLSESNVDIDLLERMLDWASDIKAFEKHHAVDGLFNAKGFLMPTSLDEEGFLLLALDIAFWFWIDDRSDRHLTDQTPIFDWYQIINLANGKSPTSPPPRPFGHEETYYLRLSSALEARAATEADHDHWRYTMSQGLRGMHFEECVNRSGNNPSFFECIEYGQASTGIPNIVATAGLVHRISRAARQTDMNLTDLEHYFCIRQRMLNDLHSSEKERREGAHGQITNVVLLMENSLGPDSAAKFIRHEISGLERMIASIAARLDDQDPYVYMFRNGTENISTWYNSKPPRYQTQP